MSRYYNVYSEDELYHFGIKGMKWGVRRYQNEDGSYKSGADGRYSDGEVGSKTSGSNSSKSGGSSSSSNKQQKKVGLIQRHKNKLISKYMEQGYSQQDAERLASRRMKTEAVVAGVAAVAVVAIGVTAAKKYGKEYCDKTFKQGFEIQNIGANENADFNKGAFFGTYKNFDKQTYRANFGLNKKLMELKEGRVSDIFNNKIILNKDIKQASISNARKTLYETLGSNSEYRDKVFKTLNNSNLLESYANGQSAESLYKNNPKKFYDMFNTALATPDFKNQNLHNTFYSALEKKGYNAILDINDSKYSGFKDYAKSPTIFFGEGQNIYNKVKNTKLSDMDMVTSLRYWQEDVAKRETAKQLGKTAAIYGTAGVGVRLVDNVAKNKIIKKYLKEHPNSKLSDKEILKMYNKKNK